MCGDDRYKVFLTLFPQQHGKGLAFTQRMHMHNIPTISGFGQACLMPVQAAKKRYNISEIGSMQLTGKSSEERSGLGDIHVGNQI